MVSSYKHWSIGLSSSWYGFSEVCMCNGYTEAGNRQFLYTIVVMYYLKYSLDNKVWNTYKENNEKKVNLRKNGLLKRANCFAAHFPSRVQTCLAANQVVANLVPRAGRREPWERGWLLQVAWILTSGWIKLSGSHAIHENYVTCCKTSLP